jgi:hypothetical protein
MTGMHGPTRQYPGLVHLNNSNLLGTRNLGTRVPRVSLRRMGAIGAQSVGLGVCWRNDVANCAARRSRLSVSLAGHASTAVCVRRLAIRL